MVDMVDVLWLPIRLLTWPIALAYILRGNWTICIKIMPAEARVLKVLHVCHQSESRLSCRQTQHIPHPVIILKEAALLTSKLHKHSIMLVYNSTCACQSCLAAPINVILMLMCVLPMCRNIHTQATHSIYMCLIHNILVQLQCRIGLTQRDIFSKVDTMECTLNI